MLPATPVDEPWGYRHKVHFVFDSTPRGPVMGHYLAGSRRVLPVRECPVHDPRGNDVAFAFAKVMATTRLTTLRGLTVRVGANTREIVATLVVTESPDKRLRAVSKRVLEGHFAPTAFHVNIHPRRDAYIFGRETRRITGPERMREEVAGTSFLVSPTAFFQTNVAAAEILVRLVLEAVGGDGGFVLDLYAGAGLFALPLAKAGYRVTAVEENRQAVEDGEASLRLNRIPADRCRFVARRVEQALGSLKGLAPRLVILDPPREGCAPAVIDEVFGRIRPERAVYISCNPEALAQELGPITRHGYAIASLQPVDMFPHTGHIETVAVLDRTSVRS
jgi:23S rRNA (uracil1939-C5)-methyltransferase